MNRSVENMYQVGDTIAGYRVVTVLGHGGMGEVYKASHPRLPRADAIKVLRLAHATDPVFRARFEREADIVAPLSHPNIVSVYDRGVFDDQLWIAMEFVPGTDVAHILEERGPLPPPLVTAIISGVAAGLDAAHRSRVTHRDIKPANILVTPGPNFLEPESVKLTDFGIAQALDEATSLTGTGTTVGTMRYASPEQIEGKQVDARSDIYSLGATAYELLTGGPPFDSPSLAGLMTAHMFHEVPRASSRNGTLNPAVDGVLARAMAKDPAQRYPTARDFAVALSEALTGRLGPSQQPTVPSNFQRPSGQFSGPPSGPGRISAPTLAGGGTLGGMPPSGPPGGPPTNWTPTQGYPNGQPGPQGQHVPPTPAGPKPWYRKLPALGAAIILLAAALGIGSGFVASSADALPTPSPPSAKAVKGAVEVEWSKVDGATSYVVMEDDRQVYSGSATSVKVPSTTPGVYTYKVSARADSVRGSDFSLPSDAVRVFLDWGVLQSVADLFPDLIPATPLSTNGYDSMECWGEDGDLAFKSTKQVITCSKVDPATKKTIYSVDIWGLATAEEAEAAAKVSLYDVKGTSFTTTQGNKGTLYLKEKYGPSAYLTFLPGDRARTFIQVSGDKLTSKQAADIVAKLPI